MHVPRRRFIAATSALFAGAAIPDVFSAGKSTGATDALDSAALDGLLDSAMADRSSPAVSLAVWQDGRERYARSVGMANLETSTPASSDSAFRIGSLTKQFAAGAILKLVDARELSLDDKAGRFLPSFGSHPSFTIRELLNHTAGLHEEADVSIASASSQVELADRIAKQATTFDFEPGGAWLYSNANYIVIGAIIEKVTGTPLATAARALLLHPLDLHRSAFDDASEVVAGRASGYSPTESGTPPFVNAMHLDVTQAGAAGAMRSTVRDLCRWHDALFSGRVVAPSSLTAMITPGKLRDGRNSSEHRFSERDSAMGETQYGLGLFLDRSTRDGSLIVQHHGGIAGFTAFLATHVPSRLTYACLFNVDGHPGLPLRGIRRSVFRHLLKP
ncbi:serine hydrolase domain-containing protein [Lysobacter brunescens]|uniref:Serine hydrolase domain-containing protein n=1 Tax=Lysobacter brunescens TaxID=262323 RepID=A0ABW2YEE2_9GAMM